MTKAIIKVIDPFTRFWDAYGYKVGRKASLRIWKRERLAGKVDEIIAALPAYEQYLRATGYSKKHPSTYLNGWHWEDEYPTVRKEGQRSFADIARSHETAH